MAKAGSGPVRPYKPGTVLHTLGLAREEAKRMPVVYSPTAPKRAIAYADGPENKFVSVDWESGIELSPNSNTHFALKLKNDTRTKHVSNERHSLLVDKALKPKLLTAMEEHLYNEMRYVKPDDFNGRIRVVRETFTMFVEQFEVYKDVLVFIRNEYDKVILMIAEAGDEIKQLKEKLGLQELSQSETYNNAMDRAARDKAELIEESAQYRARAEKRTQEMHSFRILLSQKDSKIDDLKTAINEQNMLIERTDMDLEKYKKKYEEVLNQLEMVNDDFVKFRDRSLIEQQGTLANYTQACEELRQAKRKLLDYENGNSEIVRDLTRKLEECKLRSLMYEAAMKKSKKAQQDLSQEIKRLKMLTQGKEEWYPLPDDTEFRELFGEHIAMFQGKAGDEVVSTLRLVIEELVRRLELQTENVYKCAALMQFLNADDFNAFDDAPSLNNTVINCSSDNALPRWILDSPTARNLKLSFKQLMESLAEFWAFKYSEDDSRAVASEVDHSLRDYLRQRFGAEGVALEYAINMCDAAKKFIKCPDCKLFLYSLRRQIFAETHFELSHLLEKLHQTCVEMSNDRRLPPEGLYSSIRIVFPVMEPGRMLILKYILFQCTVRGDIALGTDGQYNVDELLCLEPLREALRNQFVYDMRRYWGALGSAITTCNPSSSITNKEFQEVIYQVDTIGQDELTKITDWVFHGRGTYRYKTQSKGNAAAARRVQILQAVVGKQNSVDVDDPDETEVGNEVPDRLVFKSKEDVLNSLRKVFVHRSSPAAEGMELESQMKRRQSLFFPEYFSFASTFLEQYQQPVRTAPAPAAAPRKSIFKAAATRVAKAVRASKDSSADKPEKPSTAEYTLASKRSKSLLIVPPESEEDSTPRGSPARRRAAAL